jgi:hypothetical protein
MNLASSLRVCGPALCDVEHRAPGRVHASARAGDKISLHQRMQGVVGIDPPSDDGVTETKECTCPRFCAGECARGEQAPVHLTLYRHTPDAGNQDIGEENVETEEGVLFLLLRDIALPMLCRDEPLWRPCSRGGRLSNASFFTQLDVRFAGGFAPLSRCQWGRCEPEECSPARDACAAAGPPPPPPPRTKWTRRVPHPVLIGRAASLSRGWGAWDVRGQGHRAAPSGAQLHAARAPRGARGAGRAVPEAGGDAMPAHHRALGALRAGVGGVEVSPVAASRARGRCPPLAPRPPPY